MESRQLDVRGMQVDCRNRWSAGMNQARGWGLGVLRLFGIITGRQRPHSRGASCIDLNDNSLFSYLLRVRCECDLGCNGNGGGCGGCQCGIAVMWMVVSVS